MKHIKECGILWLVMVVILLTFSLGFEAYLESAPSKECIQKVSKTSLGYDMRECE